jgi:deoxyribodipyrimidine photolyase
MICFQAETHDNLWNAAQLQMVNEGKMHGYLRLVNNNFHHTLLHQNLP